MCLSTTRRARPSRVRGPNCRPPACPNADYPEWAGGVLDIGLPERDGCELARRLRRQPGMERALLVAVTGYGQEHDRKKALEAGFDHYLVKPVDVARLLGILGSAHPI